MRAKGRDQQRKQELNLRSIFSAFGSCSTAPKDVILPKRKIFAKKKARDSESEARGKFVRRGPGQRTASKWPMQLAHGIKTI